MNSYILRAARPTDAGRVGEILSNFIDETPWMPRVHTRAEDLSFAGELIEKGWVTVGEFDGAVMGFVARHFEKVHALYVDPSLQGQGLGAALLNLMKDDMRTLSLWSFQQNSGAQAFYLSHGFEEAERTDGAGNDEGLPDIRYVWSREDPEL